jgi:hypothetical protein
VFCVGTEQSVWVQCLRCGHVGELTAETLSRLAIAPSTPSPLSSSDCAAYAAESECEGDAQACPTAKGFLMCGRFTAALVVIASELRVRATLVVIQ